MFKKIVRKSLRKALFVFLSFSILLQNILPVIVFAQEISPATLSSDSAQLSDATSITEEVTIPVSSEESIWTFTHLQTDTEYTSPQNDKLKIKFTKLPANSGNLLIKEVNLTSEQMSQLNAVSSVAYDITSDMEDGTFEYDLELPVTAPEQSFDVEYADSADSLGDTSKISQEKEIKVSSILIKGLNHFTLFIIVDDGDSDFSSSGWSSHPTGYLGDHRWTTNAVDGKTATWTFSGTNGVYKIFLGWTIWSDHASNAQYYLNNSPLIQVDQRKMYDGSPASNGAFSDWLSSGEFTLNTGDQITLKVETGVTNGNLSADAVMFELVPPTEVWVDDDYLVGATNDSHMFGYNAFSSIQDAIDIVAPHATIHVATGNYSENVNIPSGLDGLKIIGSESVLSGTFSNNTTLSDVVISGFIIQDGSEGANLSDLNNSVITDNIFTDQTASSLNLTGDFTDTVFKYNDFQISSDTSHIYNSLTTSPLFSFNYWGGYMIPNPVVDNITGTAPEIDNNPWLVAPKDTGKLTASGYSYLSDDSKLHITGQGTGTLYVGQYSTPPHRDLGTNLSAIGAYYDIVSENGSIVWPLRIEIAYDRSNLPSGIIESELKGIYYFDNSSWQLYSDTGVDTTNSIIWANADHLTPIVAGAQQDTTAPDVSLDAPLAGSVVGSVDIFGSVTDVNPHHYYLVVKNSANQVVSGPGTVNRSDSFINQKLYTWDTSLVPDGTYTIRLEARDSQNNKDSGSTAVTQVEVDNQAPETPVHISPANGQFRRTLDTNFTDWSDVTDPNGVSYFYQSSLTQDFASLLYDSLSLTSSEIMNPGEPSGTYYWRVRACDGLGNCSAWSSPWSINIDNSGPTSPTIEYPLQNTYHKTSPILNQWSSVSDPSGIDYYRIEYQYEDGHTFPNAPYRTTISTSRNHSPAISEQGGVSIRVQAFDKSGNEGAWSEWRKYYYDSIAPSSPMLISPDDGAIIHRSAAVLDWSSVTDDSPVTYYYKSYWTGGSYGPVSVGSNHSIDARGSADRVYSWQVQACDQAGNCSPWSGPWTVTIDSTNPSAPGIPVTDPYITMITSQSWSWESSSDNLSGVQGYSFRIRDLVSSTTVTDWTLLGNVLSTNTSLTNGQYQMDLKSLDNAGNESSTVTSQTLTVDTQSPLLSANNSSSSWKKNPFKITLSVSDIGLSGIKLANYQWGSAASSLVGTAFSNGEQIDPLQGNKTLYLYAEDFAGNSVTWSGTYKYDNQSPSTPSITQPSDHGYISSSTTQIIGWTTSTDPTPGSGFTSSRYYYEIDNNDNFSSPERQNSISTNSWTLTNPLSDGSYFMRVRSKDRANNYSTWSSTLSFIVDTQAPSLFSKTDFEGWYKEYQTSDFIFTDTNGIASGGEVSCQIISEGANQTCTANPNVCDFAGNCYTTQVISNSANIDITLPESIITIPENVETESVVYINNWDGVISGTSTDNLSGVSDIKVSLKNSLNQYWNGEDWQYGEEYLLQAHPTYEAWDSWTYTVSPLPIEGSYTIVSHATDNAGNFENSYKITLVFDKTIPEVNISINPSDPDSGNGWYKTQPEVSLTATDINIEKIQYQWDGQLANSWIDYSSSFKKPSEGSGTLYYRAIDKAQNISDVGIKNIKWDQTDVSKAPQNMSINPNPTSGTSAQVKWESGEDAVGLDKYEIRWSLIGSAISYSSSVGINTFSYTIDKLTEGNWEVVVNAVDGAGNYKGVSQTLIVDRTAPIPPTLEITSTGVGSVVLGWNKISDARDYIIWYGTQSGVRQYGVRTGDVTSFTVRGLSAGNYYFIIKSSDEAQNQSGESNEVNTGSISGAPGVNPGQPAEGFTPEVQGANTDLSITPTESISPTPSVLGDTDDDGWFDWRWLLILIPPFLLLRILIQKK